MKTIRIKIYKFNELSEKAKKIAIQDFSKTLDTDFIYNDAHETVIAFNKIFNTSEGSRSWLAFKTYKIADEILELSGLKLHKYLMNNYFNDIYKPKIYFVKNKKRYSKIILEKDYVLTGVCYDEDLLKPIYEFLENFKSLNNNKNLTFKELLKECFENLEKTINDEVDYYLSEENIIEEIKEKNINFLDNGKKFEN